MPLSSRPRETAETWHTGPLPNWYVRSKCVSPLSSAEEQTARASSAYAQYAYLLSLQMGSMNLTRLD
jgi:hypothetical protein